MMTSLVELISARKSRWSSAYDGNLLAGAELWWIGLHPAHLETLYAKSDCQRCS
jgi:hypothetical protein